MFTVTLKAKAVVANANISAMCESLADVKPTSANVSEGSATLTIVNPCTGIKLDRDTLTIARGETATLTATVEPADTTDKVVWSSADKTIATVENGVVNAVGLGETTITATRVTTVITHTGSSIFFKTPHVVISPTPAGINIRGIISTRNFPTSTTSSSFINPVSRQTNNITIP